MGVFAPWCILAGVIVITMFIELLIETFKEPPWR